MKRIIFVILVLLVSATALNAQTYSINKKIYDYREYVHQRGDPYSPVASGICSFVIPGLGQMISGEVVRGFYFLGASAGCVLVVGVGAVLGLASVVGGMEGGDMLLDPSIAGGMILVGMGGMIAIDIWSIVDAIKVAKVNNMYFQDHRKRNIGLILKPYINPLPKNSQHIVPVGVTLAVCF